MALEKINHPYLTAIRRTELSVPVRYLLRHDLLKGVSLISVVVSDMIRMS